jgi:hypothetical protein
MGFYLKAGGQVFEYPVVANVCFGTFEGEKREGKDSNLDRVPVAFRGSAKGQQSALIRIELPNTKAEMVEILRQYPGGYSTFLRKGLVPQCQYAIRISSNLMEAEEALNNLSLFQSYIEDQLRVGVYKTETKYIMDSTGVEAERKQIVLRIKDGGDYVRDKQEITKIGCTFRGVQISIPVFDDAVQTAIDTRRQSTLAAETAKKRRIAAEQENIAAVAEGQKAVTEEKYKQEKAMAEYVIKAKMKREADSLLAEAAAFKKKEEILLGEGEAARKKLVMIADGALEKKLNAYVETQKLWADAFSKYSGNIVPQIQSGSGGSNGATQFMEMMGAKAAKDLSLDLSVPRGK